MSIEAMKLALEIFELVQKEVEWQFNSPVRKQVSKAQKALCAAIEQAERQEPVAWMEIESYTDEENLWCSRKVFTEYDNGRGKPLYTAPPQREWQGLVKGVRVDGDNVIVFAGNNDAARHLCGELLKEKSA